MMATSTATTSAVATIYSLPLVVSVTGCMTIALLGALLVVRSEANRRYGIVFVFVPSVVGIAVGGGCYFVLSIPDMHLEGFFLFRVVSQYM